MNIAYVRVSTVEQNEARQLEALKKFDISEWFTEKVSGKNTDRPKLQEMLKFARKGDTIYIHSLDRLARSTKDLLIIVEQLKAKEVNLYSNKELIDTNTATGKLMFTMIAAIAEFERENMLERQKEGIAIAVKNGKYKGRKKIVIPENFETVYKSWINKEITARAAMDKLGMKKQTFYNMVKEMDPHN